MTCTEPEKSFTQVYTWSQSDPPNAAPDAGVQSTEIDFQHTGSWIGQDGQIRRDIGVDLNSAPVGNLLHVQDGAGGDRVPPLNCPEKSGRNQQG